MNVCMCVHAQENVHERERELRSKKEYFNSTLTHQTIVHIYNACITFPSRSNRAAADDSF